MASHLKKISFLFLGFYLLSTFPALSDEIKGNDTVNDTVNDTNTGDNPADPKEKAHQQFINRIKSKTLRIAIPNVTLLDKELEKNKNITDLFNRIINEAKNNSNYQFVETKEKYTVTDLITSDKVIIIGNNTGADIVLSASITRLDKDILINVRIAETVIGKILYDKQYIAKQDQVTKVSDNISQDLAYFSQNLDKFNIDIFDYKTGNAEIRVKSVPNNAKVAVDGTEIGNTPMIIKNINNTQHVIEAWREEQGTIRNLNLSSTDNQKFKFKYDDKLYNDDVITLDSLDRKRNYQFEIISNPNENTEEKNPRPKASDIKYDLRKFKLEVISDPINMQVLLDNKVVGTTPLVLNDVTQGVHTIRLVRKKLFVFKKVVDSYNNKSYIADFNLYKLGRVLISSVPSKASVFLNNENIGLTPKSIDLPLGKQNIDVSREGYKNESYVIDVQEGKTNELNANLSSLRNVDTNISFLPTASVDDTLAVSAMFMSLGQYSLNNSAKTISYLYGAEANYGFKNIFSIGQYFNFGAQIGAFYNKLNTFGSAREFPGNQGVGAKIQFLSQNDTIPVSIAIGGFYNFNSSVQHQLNGYVVVTKDFGFISAHLGVQAQPFKLSAINLNVNYNRFYRIKLGASVLIDFGLLADRPGEYITPLFGLTAGYNFF